MLLRPIPPQARWVCEKLVDLLMVAICLFVVIWGGKLALETMNQSLPDLPWMPVGLTYLPLPLGSLLTLVFVLEKTLLGTQQDRAVVRFDHEAGEVPAEAV